MNQALLQLRFTVLKMIPRLAVFVSVVMILLPLGSCYVINNKTLQQLSPVATIDHDRLKQVSNCPPGFIEVVRNNTLQKECMWIDWQVPPNVLKCDTKSNSSLLQKGYCLTIGSTQGLLLTKCYSMHKKSVKGYIQLPENASELEESVCGSLNRYKTLCHRCKPGYSISPSSPSQYCTKCTGNTAIKVIVYLAVDLIPITLFYMTVLYFGVNLAAPPFSVCVFFCQMVVFYVNAEYSFENVIRGHHSSPLYSRLLDLILTAYEIWNLEFLRHLITPSCVVYFKFDVIYWKIPADMLQAMFPLFLIFCTYLIIKLHDRSVLVAQLWRPVRKSVLFKWRSKNISVIKLFASFFMLSYSKLLVSMLELIKPRVVYTLHPNGSTTTALHQFYQPKIPMTLSSSTKHPAGTITGIVLGVSIFMLLNAPLGLLMIYQSKCLQKCLTCIKTSHKQCIRTFVESFQGHYKNGLNGTLDLRFVSGGYLLLRLILIITLTLLPAFEPGKHIVSIIITGILTSASLFYAILQPYKMKHMNTCDSILLAIFQLLNVLSTQLTQPNQLSDTVASIYLTLMLLLSSIPIILSVANICYKITKTVTLSNNSHFRKIRDKITFCRHKNTEFEQGLENQPLLRSMTS